MKRFTFQQILVLLLAAFGALVGVGAVVWKDSIFYTEDSSMSDDRVTYNGVSMTREWVAEIQAAQLVSTYSVEGTDYKRVRFGDEASNRWADHCACRDCGVLKGQFHVPSCDVEQCPACNGQALTCDCVYADEE